MWRSPEWLAQWDAIRRGALGVDQPTLLWIALVLTALLALLVLWRGPHRVRVPSHARRTRWPDLDWSWALSVGLRAAALALIALSLARPVGLVPENPAGGEGLDLLIALDASGSMQALDAQLDGRRVTRLDLAKRVVADFIAQRDGDRIGLVVFGEHAFTQFPLTVDHRLAQEALQRVEAGIAGDATALGEAIGLSTRRLSVPGAPPDGRRVLLLVTDGRHNAGQLAPQTAAQIARTREVRIHAIGIGSSGPVPFAQDTPGEPLRFENVDLDRETLSAVAAISGGRFFHARKPEDLREVIAVIDQIEARPRVTDPRFRRASLVPWTLALALGALLAEAALSHGLLRRLP